MNIKLKLNTLEVPIKHFTFNGGEEQVQIESKFVPRGSIGFVDITAHLKTSSDVMSLIMLTDACRRLSGLRKDTVFTLYMPYISYARQDRVMNPGESLAIKAFCDLINNLNFDKVVVDDPHSDVSASLLNNIEIRDQAQLASEHAHYLYGRDVVIVAPDTGARKKAQKVADRFRLPIVEAGKVRNVETGKITGTTVYGDVDGLECLIVDDLIDQGGTFIALAKVLKEAGAKKVILYVTHGIFAKGKQVLYDAGIDEVYAYHDWTENF